MKTLRFVAATSLAMAMLMGTLLAMAQWQPSTASARDTVSTPLALQALPSPWLSDDGVADAPHSVPNIWPPAAVDGLIAPGEYAHAGKITFPGHGGDVEVFFREDGGNLYIAFDFPDPQTPGSAAQVFLDTNHDGGAAPQTDDYRLSVTQSGSLLESRCTGTGWGARTPVSWTAATTLTLSGWQAEFRIQYDKLGLTAGTFQVMGLGLLNAWTPSGDHYWPSGAFWLNPNSWGDLVSSSDWGTFYWKPGPWEDYAPSGMPDFDQNQIVTPTYCGPFAAANSLWWFDSKFETPDHSPPTVSDTYRLVRSYGPWDDHDISNTVPLAKDLAWYFDTDGIRTGGTWQGTKVTDMHAGTLAYLRDHGLWDDYHVTLVISPSFQWVADEVQRSEDVILLLGFYEWVEPPGYWARVGGHYVTVAGVDPMGGIAFSDPFIDAAEMGFAPGRILSGTLILPHTPGHASNVHNDAGNVSHDIYLAIPTDSPGGTWGPDGYPLAFEPPWPLIGINPHPDIPTEEWQGHLPLQVEVEFALTVSPYTWKASGEWLPEEESLVWGTWQPWQDYAPNGVPDFDQKQDSWHNPPPPAPPPPVSKWTFCGPVAAANSLWWFDSKFEPNPVGPPLPPYQPPIPYNDNYPLVQSYGGLDDHDPLNVDDPATPWPPGGEFVEDLAVRFQTDMVGSGTVITDLYTGIEQYIIDKNLRQGYVITQVKSPEFWWVAEEVEVSEDVILLLGFWQWQGENWVRLGGHYVTLPGVDKQGGFVAFSDPWFDRIEQTWPYAGIGSLPGWPSYMGRVANGWLQPHQHPPAPPDATHNDAGNVSHDIYNVVGTNSPGGVWGPEEYVDSWGSIENFGGQNGQEEALTPTGDPIQTEVEWAVAVSPVADVWITKTVTSAVAAPGDWITFTIAFANLGNDAENVIIYDALHPGLTNASYTYTLNYPGALSHDGAYTWTVGMLRWQQDGTITVTAQVDPGLSWPFTTIITNTAEITTTTPEQYQIAQAANVAQTALTVNAGGYLEGYVYDYETGSVAPPCTAAMVSIEPGGLTVTADSGTGYYGPVLLISGTYTVTASAFGYSTETAIVDVTTGVTTPQNFSLQRPVIEVTPTDFISITALVNQEVTHSLAITNAGHAAMDFEIQETPSDLTWVGVDPITGTIPGPGMTDVDVTFLCTETRDYTGTLHVIHDDPCETTPITVPIVLHCSEPPPAWQKWIDSALWYPELAVSVQTSDTLEVTDVISLSQPFTLTEAWNPEHLALITYTVDPPSGGTVLTSDEWLTWTAAGGEVVTLTKLLYVEPCTWTQTILAERVYADSALMEQRFITIAKTAPNLWIDAVYSTGVIIGELVTFTLEYGNLGGFENDVWLTSTFPISVPFVSSAPPPTTEAPDGAWAAWDVGDLAMAAEDSIAVTVAVSDTLVPDTWLTITGRVYDHVGDQADETFIKLQAQREVTGVTLVVTNTGAIYTDTVVTFNADIAPDDTTKPYTYRLTIDGTPGGVMASGDDPLVFTETFATTDTHTVEIAVWNCAMTETEALTHSVVVTVSERPIPCVEITNVALTLLTSSPIYTLTNVQFSADVTPDDADKPYTYTIDYGDGVSETTISSADPLTAPLDHVFGATGAFTVEIAVWNCAMTETEALISSVVVTVSALPPCDEVDDVNLTLQTLTTIYTDTVVEFDAHVRPHRATKPYSYTIDYGDGFSETASSSADHLGEPLNHTFAATGTFTVEIAVWNCYMTAAQAVTSSVEVTVIEHAACVEVTDVALALLTGSPIYTDTNVEFSANITPTNASTPYSYTIDYDDGTIVTTTDIANPLALNHTFATTGVYTVEIGVWNCAMTEAEALTSFVVVTVSEQILPCVGITGVDFGSLPADPQAGEVVTFTITSILPITATQPFTYQWGFGDGGAATGNQVTHTYAISDSYWAAVTATNPCGGPVWMSHPVDVTGELAITVSPLSLSAILNPGETAVVTLTIGNASTATANLNWKLAENPDRSWLDEWPTDGVVTPSGSDDVAVTFDATSQSPGVYTTTIEVTSNDPDKPQMDVSVVMTVNCIPVTGVDLVVINADTIYTDTVVEFSADIAPDNTSKPYSYTIDYGDGVSTTATSNTDPLTSPLDHPFAATGTFTVEIAVWNCSMSAAQAKTNSVQVTVSEQPTSCIEVDITDVISDSPVYLGDAMHFTATVTGDTAITYTWDFDSDGAPEQTGFGSNTASHVYSAAGIYTVTLDVANDCPSTDTYSFPVAVNPGVCESVTDIALSRASAGTIYTDMEVPFYADVTPNDATKPYTYRLTIDDAPGVVMTSRDDPLAFTETFATTGTHTIKIAAWNCDEIEVQAETDTITITVYEPGVCVPLTNITIHGETSGAPGFYTFTTSYEPTDASEPIVYIWEDNSTAATSIRNLEAGTYNLRVTAANDCTDPAVTDTHTIIVGQYIYLPLVMRGHP